MFTELADGERKRGHEVSEIVRSPCHSRNRMPGGSQVDRIENVVLQFDRPIPEREFFEIEHDYQNDPAVLTSMAALWGESGLPLQTGRPPMAMGWLLCY